VIHRFGFLGIVQEYVKKKKKKQKNRSVGGEKVRPIVLGLWGFLSIKERKKKKNRTVGCEEGCLIVLGLWGFLSIKQSEEEEEEEEKRNDFEADCKLFSTTQKAEGGRA
jgi:hypothetical protein